MALAFTACDKKNDAISEAAKADKAAGIDAPSIEEVKAIAEEAFIYGLPIVMNYAVMQEFSVDKNSGQFKAPFNTMWNDAATLTYKTRPSSHPMPTRPTQWSGLTCGRSQW